MAHSTTRRSAPYSVDSLPGPAAFSGVLNWGE